MGKLGNYFQKLIKYNLSATYSMFTATIRSLYFQFLERLATTADNIKMQKIQEKISYKDIGVDSNNQNVQKKVREAAQYIADMVLELRNMAKSVDLPTLQGLLEVSFYEAFSVANKVVIPEGEIEKLRELSRASHS